MFRLYIALGLLVAGGLFYWHYTNLVAENKRLTEAVLAANATIAKLDEKAEAEAAITDDTETLIREIENAPENYDAPVARVLNDAINRLSGDDE